MKALSRVLALAAVVVLATSPAWGFQPPAHRGEGGTIELPVLNGDRSVPPDVRSKTGSWGQFLERNPNWHVDWNPLTATPHRAFGKGIQVTGFVKSEQQATNAALRFLQDESQLTKAAGVEIVSSATLKGGRVWYAHFDQLHEGVPVLNTDITVRLGEDGKVFAFGSDVRSDIDVRMQPTLSAKEARTLATTGLTFDANVDIVTGGEDLYILPLESDAGVDYALVRHAHVTQWEPRHEWEAMVDAHTGQVHWRWDRVRHGSVSGKVTSMVHPRVPSDPLTLTDEPDTWVTVSGNPLATDAAGDYSGGGFSGSVTVSAELRGPFADANRSDGADALQSTTVDADTDPTLDFLWDDSNSHVAERSAYNSTLVVHNYIKSLDPGFTNVDFSMPVNVNLNSTCNAFWDGSSINFFAAGGGCNNTALLADVVYHEYGHGINDLLYAQAGQPLGMTSGALHEGMADVTASMLEDDPIVGDEFGTGGGIIRNVSLGNRYPDDAVGQVHTDGLIIAGSFWDLRGLVGLSVAENLAHFAKYGRPDHQSTLRLALAEYYQETLFADDDDSDLSNGTPNLAAINQAFSAHGIGPSLFIFMSHLQVEDSAASTPTNILVQAFSNSPVFLMDTSALKLIYTVDGGPEQELPLVNSFSDFYEADIPGQSSGSIVRYYLQGKALDGDPVQKPTNFTQTPYLYVVGDQVDIQSDGFQVDSGWTVGAPDDNATSGVWQRGDPEGNSVQPGDDHTPGAGTRCWVTGRRILDPQNIGANDVDDGKTTLTSVIYDLTGLDEPMVEYYRYFTNNRGAAPEQDPWVTQISNDAGANWVDMENTTDAINGWFRVVFKLEDLIAATDQMQFRFIARDDEPGSLVEALVDDFRVFDFTDLVTAVEDGIPGTRRFAVAQNRPNPFNPATEISFELPRSGQTSVTVFDLAGRRVVQLLQGDLPAGSHNVRWTGVDDRGRAVASGVYLYRVRSGEFDETRRMVLAK